MKTENLSTLKINKLSQKQYEREFSADNIEENALYLTPFGILSVAEGGTGNSFGYIRTGQSGTNIGMYATAEGYNTTSSGESAHAEGKSTIAQGDYSHAEGYVASAEGKCGHAEGENTNAVGDWSHSEGYGTTASGNCSHAEGSGTKAIGIESHAEGNDTEANGLASHAEGESTNANNYASHAEGYFTTASGESAHAEGNQTTASGNDSHSEGCGTHAEAKYSHAEGYYTSAKGEASHVQGKCNIVDTSDVYAHIVGNGSCTHIDLGEPLDMVRSNCHTLDWDGNATFAGSVTGAGADYAEYFEWLDGNPNAEDRIGLIVTLEGEKIRLANSEDDILGIISGTAMVVGDNAEWEWKDKYMLDDYGRVITEMVEEFSYVKNPETEEIEMVSTGFHTHRKLNPNYDSNQEYIRRSDRPEWSTVGLIGKIHVTDDGSCIVGGYATAGNNGIAIKSEQKTNMKVMKRISDTVILVFMK